MNKQRSTLLFITIFTLTLATGCSALEDLAGSIQKPSLSVTDVRVSDFSFEDIELTYDVRIDNPNPVSVNMASYSYDFKLNNQTFVEGGQNENSTIEASGSSNFEVPVRLNFQKVYEGVRTLATASEAGYELLGSVSFNLPVLGVTPVSFSKAGNIPMVKLPAIRIQNLQVQKLSLSSADLVLNMEFENSNAFRILVNGFNYDLQINGDDWASGRALQQVNIERDGITQLEIPISLNIAEMGLSIYRMLSGSGDLNYQLNGTFDLGTDHPLLGQTNFQLNRSGSLPLRSN
jgi:LEA14-like dessication related protein